VTGVRAHVIEAELELADGLDAAAVGAAVTVELCGHWEHDGPCRWPHNSAIDTARAPAGFRTLFVAGDAEAQEVGARVEAALRGARAWRVVALRTRGVQQSEQALAGRLLSGPRAVG
jgi:hypothetical protein